MNFENIRLEEKSVLFGEEGLGQVVLGSVQLNRPKKLNALNEEMYKKMQLQLESWLETASVKAILIEGAGSQAFCAGGDVKNLVLETREKGLEVAKSFFHHEYYFDYFLHCFPKPVVCLGDHIVMGAGMGLMQASNFPIVTERSVLAMPEVAIGLFPDVGATEFLSKVPKGLGYLFGLSGQRLTGPQAYDLGLAKALVPSQQLRKFRSDLLRLPYEIENSKNIEILNTYIESFRPEKTLFVDLWEYLKEVLGNPLEQTFEELSDRFKSWEPRSDLLEFCQPMRDGFLKGSPFAQKVFLEAAKRNHSQSRRQALELEWQLAVKFSEDSDFDEGVRAVLIDKDQNAKWKDCSQLNMESYFEEPAIHLLRDRILEETESFGFLNQKVKS